MASRKQWTARGTGKCICGFTYTTFKKPAHCPECNNFIGGKHVPGREVTKKKRLDNPNVVTVCFLSDSSTLYSVKVTTRDDRCFCLVAVGSRLCYYHKCKDLRSVAGASGQLDKFSCEHLDFVKESISSTASYCLTKELLDEYPGSSEVKSKMQLASDHAKQLGVSQVIRVSESSYAVCALPDTYAEIGFVHVKHVAKGDAFRCSISQCAKLVGGKQLKTRHVCLHLHLLFCCTGSWKSNAVAQTQYQQPISTSTSSVTSVGASLVPDSIDQEPSQTVISSSVSRVSTVKLNVATRYPYHLPLTVLNAARTADSKSCCDLDGGWPNEFIPKDVTCRLCGSILGQPRCHPGSKGSAFLVTNGNPFLTVNIKVKMCSNKDCQAMHQVSVYDFGLFNASDKVLIALEILLEWRELFKRGVPLSIVIESKLKSLLQTVSQDHAPPSNTVEYLSDILYNAFYCFELLTIRSMDDAICGLCGTVGEVYFGDGNAKNCCTVDGVDYRLQTKPQKLLQLEEVLDKITSHFVEATTYTRTNHKMSIHIGEVPPIIAPSQRHSEVFNTEVDKKSVYITDKSDIEGDPAMLHMQLQQQKFDVDNIQELTEETLVEICNDCSISTHQRSSDFLRGRLLALYASILVGKSPCHNFTHVPGHTGGFYHIVCPHECTIASKFLLLQESVRDAADLYLSLKYPPVLFICDTPCGVARHIDRRCGDVAEQLWGDNVGCFEKPSLEKSPGKIDLPELATSVYKEKVNEVENLAEWQHPISGKKRRYIAGDRFHTSTNPHKSPLCAYHDINLLEQSNCIKTSYQESMNHQKNRRLQCSTVQSFFVHFLYNHLMDFYGNEAIVQKQRKVVASRLRDNEVIIRDEFHRFVLKETK